MNLKMGDQIYVVGKGLTSGVIQAFTYSLPGVGFSHVMTVGDLHGRPILYESTSFGRPPCVRAGQVVCGVQAHWPEDIIKPSRDATYYHAPLRRELYWHEQNRYQEYLDSVLGRGYDFYGAAKSGGFLLRYAMSMVARESNAHLFCSELCAEALVYTGVWNNRHYSRWNPNSLYRRLYLQGIINKAKRIEV